MLVSSIGSQVDDLDQIEDNAYLMKNDTELYAEFFENNDFTRKEKRNTLYEPELSEEVREWVMKINQLCNENGAELLLIKVPVYTQVYDYGAAWTSIKSDQMKSFSEETGIPFLDLQYDVDLEIDLSDDYKDGGKHLNYLGAKKVSSYLADYLVQNYDVGGKTDPQMENNLPLYNRLTDIALLQLETDFASYLKNLNSRKEECIICMSARDDMCAVLSDEDIRALHSLGLQSDFEDTLETADSFLAYIDGGEVIYEAISNRKLSYTPENVDSDLKISIVSSGKYSTANASIKVNGKQNAVNTNGINIVVIDKDTGMVLDSVAFDTSTDTHSCTHKDSLKHLDEYWLEIDPNIPKL